MERRAHPISIRASTCGAMYVSAREKGARTTTRLKKKDKRRITERLSRGLTSLSPPSKKEAKQERSDFGVLADGGAPVAVITATTSRQDIDNNNNAILWARCSSVAV
ncbi:hypothetical protein pqer_cds_317 [Pandoravirus quercus]|nr:hypothetical protein pqer_cds_317 [Pandoravirus quercus]AVK74739.1 hypothetical protein pqer_cds_317 [Pandoravirus quercus]